MGAAQLSVDPLQFSTAAESQRPTGGLTGAARLPAFDDAESSAAWQAAPETAGEIASAGQEPRVSLQLLPTSDRGGSQRAVVATSAACTAVPLGDSITEIVLRDLALWLRPAGWPPLPDAARRRTLLLAWTAILTQAVFLGGWILAGALEPRFSPIRQYISELGRDGGAHPWIFTIFVVVWGLGFIALAVAVVPSLRTRPWPLAMPLTFVLAGVCAILIGPLRMDCSPTLSAVCESRFQAGAASWHYYAHVWLSLGIDVSLLLTGIAFARSAWPSRLGRLVLGGTLAILAAWLVTFFLHDSFAGYQGLEERLWALVAQLWALVCATVLILEATLTPAALRAHEASVQRHPLGDGAVGVDPV